MEHSYRFLTLDHRRLIGRFLQQDEKLSVAGVTGPAAGRAGLPIGTFWIGLSVKDGEDTAIELHLDGDRDACKRGAAQAALDLLGEELSA